jgi:hypothetical protein
VPEDKFLLMSRKGKRLGVAYVSTPPGEGGAGFILNSSPATWGELPLPPDAMLILPGWALAIGDELGNRIGWNRWIHHHDEGPAHDVRDRPRWRLKNESRTSADRKLQHCLGRPRSGGLILRAKRLGCRHNQSRPEQLESHGVLAPWRN